MLRNFYETPRYVDQDGGKRKGSFAVYLEPWHADMFDLLELEKAMARRSTVHVTCSMLYGLQICPCAV